MERKLLGWDFKFKIVKFSFFFFVVGLFLDSSLVFVIIIIKIK